MDDQPTITVNPAWAAAARDLLVEEIYVCLSLEREDCSSCEFHVRECESRRRALANLSTVQPAQWWNQYSD